MAILKHKNTVDFQPENKAHREAVQAFMKRNHWGDTDLRFNSDPKYGSIIHQVQEKLLLWYMERDKDSVEV
jgi:hypothetical protein